MKLSLLSVMKRSEKVASFFFISISLLTAALLSPMSGSAKPAYPGIIDYTQPDGSIIRIRIEGDENSKRILSEDGKTRLEAMPDGFLRPAALRMESPASEEQRKFIFSGTPFPSEGEPHALVVLVNFNDNRFSRINPRTFYQRMLNEPGFFDYEATGSARDYFIENSGNAFRPHFDVYGPITLREYAGYYGANDMYGNDLHPEQMCIEACQQLDPDVDFSKYDLNDDGYIDNIYLIYAGFGEADTGTSNLIWPHSANLEDFDLEEQYVFDGKILNRYGMSNEMDFVNQRPDGIGTFVHEFCHVLGLPDLYATSYTFATTPGAYSALDTGSYNNQGRTPPNLSSFERMSLGWLQPELMEESGDYSLPPLADSNKAFIIPTENEDEFFLFECRKAEGADAYLPGEGMLVWHIDFHQNIWDDNIVNNNGNHQYVDIVEADGVASRYSRAGDTFPGEQNVRSFSFSTIPSLASWMGVPTGRALSDIAYSHSDGITFRMERVNDETGDNEDSGVDDITDTSSDLWSLHGQTLTNVSASPITIYNLSGARIAILKSGESLTLSPAIYILNSPDFTTKTVVK